MSNLFSQNRDSTKVSFGDLIENGEKASSEMNWGLALIFFHDALKIAEKNNLDDWLEWLTYQIKLIHKQVEKEKDIKSNYSDENINKFNELIDKGEEANEGKNWKLACLMFNDALKIAQDNEYSEWIYWLNAQINRLENEIKEDKNFKDELKEALKPIKSGGNTSTDLIFSNLEKIRKTFPQTPTLPKVNLQSKLKAPVLPQSKILQKGLIKPVENNQSQDVKELNKYLKEEIEENIYKKVENLVKYAQVLKSQGKWDDALQKFQQATKLLRNETNSLIFKGVVAEFREFNIERFINEAKNAILSEDLKKAKEFYEKSLHIANTYGINNHKDEIIAQLKEIEGNN
jgi:tetratricopeptide (TPR) repeat protein